MSPSALETVRLFARDTKEWLAGAIEHAGFHVTQKYKEGTTYQLSLRSSGSRSFRMTGELVQLPGLFVCTLPKSAMDGEGGGAGREEPGGSGEQDIAHGGGNLRLTRTVAVRSSRRTQLAR